VRWRDPINSSIGVAIKCRQIQEHDCDKMASDDRQQHVMSCRDNTMQCQVSPTMPSVHLHRKFNCGAESHTRMEPFGRKNDQGLKRTVVWTRETIPSRIWDYCRCGRMTAPIEGRERNWKEFSPWLAEREILAGSIHGGREKVGSESLGLGSSLATGVEARCGWRTVPREVTWCYARYWPFTPFSLLFMAPIGQ
jgi:hypothetical protein